MIPLEMVVSVLFCIFKVFVVCLGLLLARGVLWLVDLFIVKPLSDPLSNLPGPTARATKSHFSEVMDPSKSPSTHEDWQKKYGKTFRFHGFGKHDYRMMSFDFRVVSHILTSTTYEKPWQTRSLLARLIGRGIFSMEGVEHKFQRRLIGPAFTSQAVKSMVPIFLQKAQQLCDRWNDINSISSQNAQIQTNGLPLLYTTATSPSEKSRGMVIDVAHWMSRASFDIIGLAGFDYNFRALEDESERVYNAYRRMFEVAERGPRLRGFLELYFPIVSKFWPSQGTRIINECLRVIGEAGNKLILAKKADALVEPSKQYNDCQKDILSLLITANLCSDPSKRLTDAELLDQCSTFLLAGSESVSLALAWCLHYLSLNPSIQSRLRDEILSTTNSIAYKVIPPTTYHASHPPACQSAMDSLYGIWDKIEALPYLDSVVRETLRLSPPVHATIRVATSDDQIPVSHPVTLRDGTIIESGGSITIRKGSYIHIPVEGLNLSTDLWGGDAHEFNPDRWISLPTAACGPAHPGLVNLMTFGLGPHSCLGYKFSINEIKAFLVVVIPQFNFSPAADIAKYNSILTRPYVVNRWELGTQLPLIVRAQ